MKTMEASEVPAEALEFSVASGVRPEFVVARQPEAPQEKVVPIDELFDVIDRAPKDIPMSPERRDKQTLVLKNLPSDLIEQVRGYLYAHAIEQKHLLETKYHREIKDEEVLRDDTQTIRGLLHEMLVEAEGNLKGSTPVSREILSALQNPERHNTQTNTTLGEALKGKRTPDTARAELKEKGNVVNSLTHEAKKGSLDLRAAQQLGPYGVIEEF